MPEKSVAVYSTPTCPHCARVKQYLTEKNIPFTDYNVMADREAAKRMVDKTQQLTVPVIIIDDKEIVVGFNPARLDELLKAENQL